MCSNCERHEEELEGITNARDLLGFVGRLRNNGVEVPDQLVRLVRSIAAMEEFSEANPQAGPDEYNTFLVNRAMRQDAAALDQEFAMFRAKAWELIDLAGTIAVVEEDSTRRWLKIAQHTMSKHSVPEVIGIFTALLAELGRQPELVDQIRTSNERIF